MDHITGTDDPRVRARAYELWEREGRPEGRHIAHWLQASREIAEEDAAPVPIPGPGAGLQVPDSASERTLREAAAHLRGLDREEARPRDPSSEPVTDTARIGR